MVPDSERRPDEVGRRACGIVTITPREPLAPRLARLGSLLGQDVPIQPGVGLNAAGAGLRNPHIVESVGLG